MQAQVHSPIYTGGLWTKDNCAIVDPARLVWGLKAAAERLGVRIYEDTKATELKRDGIGVIVTTPLGAIRAGKVALGTNAFKPILKRLEQLHRPRVRLLHGDRAADAEQMESIGWNNRQGLSDLANQFHYYRLTEDNRILWGGYDAIYYWGGKVSSELESRPETWAKLSRHFFETFPQLDGGQVHPHVGRGDRHVEPVHGVLGAGDERPRRLRARLHRARRRRLAVRRVGDARPARRAAFARHPDRVRQVAAAAVPARAVPLRRHPGDASGAWTARTRPASATSGCAASTGWASASTRDRSRLPRSRRWR